MEYHVQYALVNYNYALCVLDVCTFSETTCEAAEWHYFGGLLLKGRFTPNYPKTYNNLLMTIHTS